jgi:hypothetical protein
MWKKVIIGAVVILGLLLIAEGVFWLKNKKEYLGEPISKNTFANPKDYEIIETPEGKLVENKKEGFKMLAPKEWQVVMGAVDNPFDPQVILLSPEVENNNFIKSAKEKGACGMSVEIYKSEKVNPGITTFADDLRNEIADIQSNIEKYRKEEHPRNEVILVDNNSSIKRTYIRDGKVTLIETVVPVGQTVYNFSSGLIVNQKCVEEFNKILSTVSINK